MALLALVVAIFFWPVLSGQAWIPRGGGDLVSFIYPMYRFAARSLLAGEIPLWNPYLYAGAPFVADNQSGLFYPFNLLLFLFHPNFGFRAIEGLVIWHFFFAGAGMYLCLRWWRPFRPIHRLAALAGAISFMFSGVFITHIGNLNLIAVIAWLPLAFGALHRAFLAPDRRSRLAWTAGSGLALGAATLAGHGQSTFLVASYLGAYALYRAVAFRDRWSLPLLAVVGLVAVGASAISLIPALEMTPYTLRAGFTFEQSASYSLPWEGLVGLLAPEFYGRGAADFWQMWPRVEYGYAGVLPWLLAIVALIRVPGRRRTFFALAGALFLILALGSNTPIYALVFGRLPTVPFRAPARFVLLLDFSLAMLAGIGLDSLYRSPWSRRQWRWALGGMAVLALLLFFLLVRKADSLAITFPGREEQMVTAALVFLSLSTAGLLIILGRAGGRLSPKLTMWLSLFLLTIDLVGLGRFVEIEGNDPTLGFAESSPALAYIKADAGLHRVDIASGKWQPSLPQIERLYGVAGVYNPLQLSNYTVFTGSMGPRGSPLYNLLGAKYVIGGKSKPPADTTIIVPVFDEDPQVIVYLNTLALPRVSLLYDAQVAPDHEAAFQAIHDPQFDPRETIIVEGGEPLAQSAGQAQIRVVGYGLNTAAFEVSTDRPAYFLLTDIYHPHWRATDNGGETEIFVADYAFRAVFLQPGRHDVVYRFEPPGWPVGLAFTGLTWLAAIGLVAWLWRTRPV